MVNIKILMSILAVLLLFSACANTSGNNSQYDYYTGREGVSVNFESGSPPYRINYYADTPDENYFNFYVEAHNKGASYSKGGIYIAGYNPYMLKIDGIDIQKTSGGWGDCDVDFGFNSNPFGAGNDGNAFGEGGSFWKSLQGSLNCEEGSVNYNSDTDWSARINNLGDFLPFEVLEGVSVSADTGTDSYGISFPDGYNIKYLNRGAGMIVMMSGMDFSNYGGREYLLRPNDKSYPGGERITEAFTVNIENWPKEGLTELKDVTFLLTNCYLYSTYFADPVCIDPAPYEDVPKSCVARTIINKVGQGAPVAVTKVETTNTRTTTIFDITVENIGPGRVFNMGYMSACSPYGPERVTSNYLNKVYLLDARIGDQQLKCEPDRGAPIQLIDNKRLITCSYLIDYGTIKSAFTVPLVLEFGYGYQETAKAVTKMVKV